MTLGTVVFLAGVAMLILALVGSGFDLKVVGKVPPFPVWARLIMGIVGPVLMAVTLLGYIPESPDEKQKNPPPVTPIAAPPPTPVPSASAPAVAPQPALSTVVDFRLPEAGKPITGGSAVKVAGTVSGLPAGTVLWILSVSLDDATAYNFISDGPVATRDGAWGPRTDAQAGDSSDSGLTFSYIAFVADSSCNAKLVGLNKEKSFDLPGECQGKDVARHDVPVI